MSTIVQSRAFGGLVMLYLMNDNASPVAFVSTELLPNEARLLDLELIREADRAEREETS